MSNGIDKGCIKVHIEQLRFDKTGKTLLPLRDIKVQLYQKGKKAKTITDLVTGENGVACFDQLDLNTTYVIGFPFQIDQDQDGHPEYEFVGFKTESLSTRKTFQLEVSSSQDRTPELEVPVTAPGACTDGSTTCVEKGAVYKFLPVSVALDAVEDLRSIRASIDDIASYTPTSEEVTSPAARAGGASRAGAEAPLQQVVDGALMEVLGRRLKMDDSQAFLASLNRAFIPEEVNGRTKFKWTPRSYAVQTELGGAITGAQASLYRRARVAFEEARPLLDQLEPLIPEADEENVEAVRNIVRAEFAELVEELGLEGGPRIQRVDDIFELLENQLTMLEGDFGLKANRVNTVDEEQNLTNFLVIKDYIIGLHQTWINFRAELNTKFLGTQLVLLSRALSSVAESVDETYRVMDSVRLGPAERQTVPIRFPKKIRLNGDEEPILPDGSEPPPLLVEELLSWVARFAAEEGPTLVQEGGRRGVNTIEEIAQRLQRLVLGASQARVTHIGFSRSRVQRTLTELASQLEQAVRLASEAKVT